MLVKLFSSSAAVSIWWGELCRLLFSEELFVLALLKFLRLSNSFRNFLLCKLLAVLYAKYLQLGAVFRCYLRCEVRCYLFVELLLFVLFNGDNSSFQSALLLSSRTI